MIGFPSNYGDQLSEEQAIENFNLFFKQYGPTICFNAILFLLLQNAYAADVKTPCTWTRQQTW